MTKYFVFLGNASYGPISVEADQVVWTRDDVSFRADADPLKDGSGGVVARFNRGDLIGYTTSWSKR